MTQSYMLQESVMAVCSCMTKSHTEKAYLIHGFRLEVLYLHCQQPIALMLAPLINNLRGDDYS